MLAIFKLGGEILGFPFFFSRYLLLAKCPFLFFFITPKILRWIFYDAISSLFISDFFFRGFIGHFYIYTYIPILIIQRGCPRVSILVAPGITLSRVWSELLLDSELFFLLITHKTRNINISFKLDIYYR